MIFSTKSQINYRSEQMNVAQVPTSSEVNYANIQMANRRGGGNMVMPFSTPKILKTIIKPAAAPPLSVPRNVVITEEKKEPKKMIWGEPTWFLFHTIAEKVKEEHFVFIRVELLNIIFTICSNLPCPICTKHATEHLNGVNFNGIQTKQQLKDFLFDFHNIVNRRKGFSPFEYGQLNDKYSKANTNLIIANFMNHFSNKHKNTRLIADDFIRTKIVQRLSEWFYNHLSHFSV